MEAYPEQAITVSMLVSVSGVSGRSLFAGFERILGMSPMRYLRDVRLGRVRQDSLYAGQPRGVTQIATR